MTLNPVVTKTVADFVLFLCVLALISVLAVCNVFFLADCNHLLHVGPHFDLHLPV